MTKISGNPSAAGDGVVRFTAASLGAGSNCQAVMNVTSLTVGAITNTTNGPTTGGPVYLAGTPGSASLNVVVAPPTIAKAFGAASIALNGTTTLTFTLTNPAANTVALTGVAFTDTLPAGLSWQAPMA